MNKKIYSIAIVLAGLLGFSSQVTAEWSFDLYLGESMTKNHDATVDLPNAGISGTHHNLQFDSAFMLGARGGYWFDAFPYLGLGLDVSNYFGPNQRAQSSSTTLCITGVGCSTASENIKKFANNVTALALDVMLRYPLLVSSQFSQGRLQPYLMIGPALFNTTFNDTGNFTPAGQSSTSNSIGIEVATGLTYMFKQRVGAFLEYRDVNFSAKDQFYNSNTVHDITLGNTIGNATFNIQTILAGVTVRF